MAESELIGSPARQTASAGIPDSRALRPHASCSAAKDWGEEGHGDKSATVCQKVPRGWKNVTPAGWRTGLQVWRGREAGGGGRDWQPGDKDSYSWDDYGLCSWLRVGGDLPAQRSTCQTLYSLPLSECKEWWPLWPHALGAGDRDNSSVIRRLCGSFFFFFQQKGAEMSFQTKERHTFHCHH